MLGHVKKIVPRPLKDVLRSTLNAGADRSDLSARVVGLTAHVSDLSGHLERLTAEVGGLGGHVGQHTSTVNDLNNSQMDFASRLKQLEESVSEIQDWLFLLQPEVLQPSEAARVEAAAHIIRAGLDPGRVNLNVCKNDLMFQFLAWTCSRIYNNVERAFGKYVRSGLQMLRLIDAIVSRKFGVIGGIPAFLDFASGYGRLTRFLVQALEPDRVWVSDVKPRAVEFQRREFGVHGFVSTAEPDELRVAERFDCIFVGSLFSHLPEAVFARWLQRLCDLLTPTGVIIFSVHDAAMLDGPEQAFTYNGHSEEVHLRSADGPLNSEGYGSAFVSESFVRAVIQGLSVENKRYARYKKALWDRQDVYVLSRDAADDFTGLTLPAL